MTFFRALVVVCLIATVPVTALAGAIDQGHCKDSPAQGASAGMDPSMHAGHVMDSGASIDHSVQVKGSKAANGCNCGCDCSTDRCASSFSGFLSADLAGRLVDRFADRYRLTITVAHISAAHHLDLLRPPARA